MKHPQNKHKRAICSVSLGIAKIKALVQILVSGIWIYEKPTLGLCRIGIGILYSSKLELELELNQANGFKEMELNSIGWNWNWIGIDFCWNCTLLIGTNQVKYFPKGWSGLRTLLVAMETSRKRSFLYVKDLPIMHGKPFLVLGDDHNEQKIECMGDSFSNILLTDQVTYAF